MANGKIDGQRPLPPGIQTASSSQNVETRRLVIRFTVDFDYEGVLKQISSSVVGAVKVGDGDWNASGVEPHSVSPALLAAAVALPVEGTIDQAGLEAFAGALRIIADTPIAVPPPPEGQ